MRTSRRGQSGFTLVEMMVVVVIIAILAALAVSGLDPKPRADDGAQVIAQMAHEAGREAVSRGAVRADVALANGPERSRLLISEAGDIITVSVEILVEDDLPSDGATWVEVGSRSVGHGVTITGYTSYAELTDGQAPETAGAGPIEVKCTNDGTCGGLTVYLAGGHGQQSRVVILPLGGETMTFLRW